MSEVLKSTIQWRSEINDRFLSRPQDAERRQLFEERGLLFTNNFSLYLRDLPELMPELPHPYNYKVKPFASVLQRLRDTHGELCEEITRVEDLKARLIGQYWDVIKSLGIDSPEARELASQIEPLEWYDAEVCTRAMEIVGPWLVEAGFRPVDLCG